MTPRQLYKQLSDHDRLQIEQAALCGVSGPLHDWPALDSALEECDLWLPGATNGQAVRLICQLLVEET